MIDETRLREIRARAGRLNTAGVAYTAPQAYADVSDLLAFAEAALPILRAVAASDPETSFDHGMTSACFWCEAIKHWPEDGSYPFIQHTPTCTWTNVRALLAGMGAECAECAEGSEQG